ncbi:thiamine phosphate synthase [Rhodoblastus acidophilus]|uniref:Thiamine-phosphate synthase n=1 Tax=Candidatus Rhodoblastus alkanivorans TaxID=2954117 RepID=A0ABS9Z7C0_9HYPH|nr:thiamine phosphate synthase [Candidatus Rhodoblastus alkanivorans]MCI4678696.1 thiamine phosphate synthase [Candidatus Rhodoblastus alkanivorans]MCI4683508.1 thiamine phosphate synthase [Candidatus Rhodoblastus alkanivorans]MDI4640823.1 thiamine phosphate synthase [Rhodoblastus acidophilus]
MSLDPFYLIVDHVDWLRRLLPCGVKLAQLRVKNAAEDDLRAQIIAARDLCRYFGAQLIVNDYWRLALELGCDFVHLGQEDLIDADLAAIRRGGLKLGVSTHDDAELAKALAARPDYVALGPIFPTLLKKMPWAPQGLEKIGRWKQKIGALPLVAIGGLTPERAVSALSAGAQSAAVVTDITLNPDPEARARQWVATTRAFV